MLRINRERKILEPVPKVSLADGEHWERQIQTIIVNDPDPFCDELGESLWIIGQEVHPSDTISDRVDILAIDEEGSAVIIELKRGTNKLQMFQAISYAGMIRHWPAERFIKTLSENYEQSAEDAEAAIEDHMSADISAALNQSQRIILIAEDFDPALLFGAEWLYEEFNINIRCYRIELSTDEGKEYLTFSRQFPPVDISSLKRGRGAASDNTEVPLTWDEALAGVDNEALVNFFRVELANQRDYFENRPRYKELIYRIRGDRRFNVGCRQRYAYVWQHGRFPDDRVFWTQRLSSPTDVSEVARRKALRFKLINEADFAAFAAAMNGELRDIQFRDDLDFEGRQQAPADSVSSAAAIR